MPRRLRKPLGFFMTFPTPIDKHLSSAEKFNRANIQAKRGGDSGGTTPPSGIESRVARLEASVLHIESDIKDIKSDIRDLRKTDEINFRITFAAIITTALGLAGLMAKGFGWL